MEGRVVEEDYGKRHTKVLCHMDMMESDKQGYRAGETKPPTQEPFNQKMGNVEQKAEYAKEKTKGVAQEKSDQSKEKASEMGQSTKEWAQCGKVKEMAQECY
ncbi:unnamed protein product [Sphenostylis stenocarpa]|uniref:Uncharacterized protein n=1 Tax=Sphenostylis stenocarpa TaxID=92480 RepID=A0AA86SBX8_9FABA|nr:unnamed protein product [Sphenostylis stenocarpa]